MKPLPIPEIRVLETVTDYTRMCGLPASAHPLLTVIDLELTRGNVLPAKRTPMVQHFYSVWVKKNLRGKVHYGHQRYDFGEGVMGFQAPGQAFAIDATLDISQLSGWMVLFHSDLLRKYPLGQKISSYGFFSYAVHEALHLSAQEETALDALLDTIRAECGRPIDAFSQDVLVAQLDVLLNYANRFYHRQFITRRTVEHDLLSRFETLLTSYFAIEHEQPLPTVQHFADALHVSPAYLSDMLRTLTGQTTRQHLHHALIEKAKRLLLTTSLTINETAFRLGFEYPQYFTRLFKSKTGRTPAAFRFSAQ